MNAALPRAWVAFLVTFVAASLLQCAMILLVNVAPMYAPFVKLAEIMNSPQDRTFGNIAIVMAGMAIGVAAYSLIIALCAVMLTFAWIGRAQRRSRAGVGRP